MIHYHGCPFSGGTFTQLAFAGKHAMISFAANENAEMIIELCQSFCFLWKEGGLLNFLDFQVTFPC